MNEGPADASETCSAVHEIRFKRLTASSWTEVAWLVGGNRRTEAATEGLNCSRHSTALAGRIADVFCRSVIETQAPE